MQPFVIHSGTAAVLWRDNVDTDQIIPKDFLKSVSREGFGEHLFQDWRRLPNGNQNPDFELNKPEARGATIFISGNNFGCGSSREHAVWAIQQYGFRVVIAPIRERSGIVISGFADIFRNNALKNGLLTVELSIDDVDALRRAVEVNPQLTIGVDLSAQTICYLDKKLSFIFNPAAKEKLLKGLDDIGLTLADEAAIRDFEKRHDPQMNS